MTLVSAPAGYGKTSLVVDWIRSVEAAPPSGIPYRFCWFSLEESDNEPLTFFSYLIASLQKAAPGIGDAARSQLRQPRPLSPQVILSSLINELALIPEPIVIILDDYQLIHTRLIHENLVYFLDHMPSTTHVIITTRADPPIPLHRYRARGQLVEIRLDDLRFTSAELTDFIRGAVDTELTAEEIDILEERTEGWIAGIQMAALSMRGKANASQFIRTLSGNQRFILDYLAEEVLQGQPQAVQKFLVETSFLSRMCAPLCDAVLEFEPGDPQDGLHSSEDILAHLDRANLFVLPLDEERCWFRYHHLFADLLGVRLKQLLKTSSLRLSELNRRAGGWFEQNELIGEAVHHYIAAGDFEVAAQLVEQNTMRLFTQGELQRLISWIHLLPAELARRRPWLSIYQAWALVFAGKLAEIDALLQQAEQSLASPSYPIEDQYRMRYEMTAIRGMAALTSNHIREALEICASAERDVPFGGLFAHSVIRWTQGYAWRILGDIDRSITAFSDVLQTGRQLSNSWTILTASVDLGMALRLSGRLRESEAVYREGLQQIQAIGAGGYGFVGRLESFLANTLYEKNELDEARQLAFSSIEHNRLWENPNHSAHAYWTLARVYLGMRNFKEAELALSNAERYSSQDSVIESLKISIQATCIRIWLEQGRLSEAAQWAADHPLEIQEKPQAANEQTVTLATTLSRIKIACGDFSGALSLLAWLEPAIRASGRVNILIEILLLKALAEQDTPLAHAALQEALDTGLPEGYLRIYLDEGDALKKLLSEYRQTLREDTPQAVSTDLLLTAFPVPVETPQAAPRYRPDLLSQREIEVLQCMAEGMTNQEIGKKLFISTGTVKAHTAAIYRKLDVAHRAAAVSRAKDLEIL